MGSAIMDSSSRNGRGPVCSTTPSANWLPTPSRSQRRCRAASGPGAESAFTSTAITRPSSNSIKVSTSCLPFASRTWNRRGECSLTVKSPSTRLRRDTRTWTPGRPSRSSSARDDGLPPAAPGSDHHAGMRLTKPGQARLRSFRIGSRSRWPVSRAWHRVTLVRQGTSAYRVPVVRGPLGVSGDPAR